MRDYDACFLCLQTARDPVCCPEGHIACKECIYENILAQKQEIQRQAKQVELQTVQEAKEQENKELLAQQIILDEFEKSQMGVLSKAASVRTKSSPSSPATRGDSNGKSMFARRRRIYTVDIFLASVVSC
jgi:nitric oxide synthase-interacting protein